MSLSHTSSIPVLKAGITITPYEQSAGDAPSRFLLALDDSHFLVSIKTRALVLALLGNPVTEQQFETGFASESGQHLPAATLLVLAQQTLPASLFRDTPSLARSLPFMISLTLLGPRLAARVTSRLAWLFKPRLMLIFLAAFVLLHGAVLPDAMRLAHGAGSARETVALILLFMFSGLVHELGHTSACRHFGCPHGGIGIGLYLIFPAWYADVTKAWRLPRRQRAVVDLGGVYFQSILLIAVDAYALATGNPLALKLSWLITFAMLFTLNPVFKFDGYWLLSDLSGLHNLHKQVRDTVAALVCALLGRRRAARPTLRSAVLYAYSALSICYFSYFGLFLIREIGAFGTVLMPRLAAAWQSMMVASQGAAWEIVVAAGTLIGVLLWPLMVLLASAFLLNRLRRAVLAILVDVRKVSDARDGLDPRQTPTHDQLV
jgi:putative peptide zinc metalloprotease protein